MAVVFLLWLIAEIAAVWAVGSVLGPLPTLGLLLAGTLVGSWFARRERGKAARAAMETMRAGRSPHAEMTDGMLVGLGTVLIFVPGFVSDVAGLLLLLPPTRGVVRRAWVRRVERRGPVAPGGGFGRNRDGRVIVVDSEVVSDERGDPGQRPGRPIIESE